MTGLNKLRRFKKKLHLLTLLEVQNRPKILSLPASAAGMVAFAAAWLQ